MNTPVHRVVFPDEEGNYSPIDFAVPPVAILGMVLKTPPRKSRTVFVSDAMFLILYLDGFFGGGGGWEGVDCRWVSNYIDIPQALSHATSIPHLTTTYFAYPPAQGHWIRFVFFYSITPNPAPSTQTAPRARGTRSGSASSLSAPGWRNPPPCHTSSSSASASP